MNLYKSTLPIPLVLLTVTTGWLMIGCSAGASTTRYLVNEADKMVGMEVTYREGSQEYSHPAALTPEHVEKFLQHIEVHPSSLLDRIVGGSSTAQEAFSEEQRKFFSENISKAFEEASPLEIITFYSAIPRGNGIWEITSGGMYLEDHELHLVLPNYRYTVPATTSPQLPRTNPLRALGEPLHSLKSVDPVRQVTHPLAKELWTHQTPHFILPLHDLDNIKIPSKSPHGPPSNSTEPTRKSSSQRLKNLEELRKEGLLTEKEYQHKRQEILNQL